MFQKRRFDLILFAVLLSLPLFFFPKHVFAALYINEFSSDTSPDWVEIYNNSSAETVDLALYKLKDNSTSGNEKDLSGQLAPGGFISFDWGNSLNKTGDIINLIKINDGFLIDKVAYGDQGTDVTAPSSAQTGGRQIDGTGGWVIFSISTKNATNNTSTPVPTATLTPTPSPTPTTVPTPTKTPTPTSTPKPAATSTPKPANTATPVPTVKATATNAPTITIIPTKTEAKITTTSAVLGEKIEVPPKVSSHTLLPQVFMGLGATCLLGCGILVFRAYKKGKIVWHE